MKCSNIRRVVMEASTSADFWMSSQHIRSLASAISDPPSLSSDLDDVREEDVDDDDNSTIILAIREHSKQMDSWFEDESGNLEVRHRHHTGLSEEDEDGLKEEELALQYSQEMLRQELEVVDLILSPRISGGGSCFFPPEEDRGDTYSDVTGFLEQYEQRLQKHEEDNIETRDRPPTLDCPGVVASSPYFLSACMPRDAQVLATAISTMETLDEEYEEEELGDEEAESFDLLTPYTMHRQTRPDMDGKPPVQNEQEAAANSRHPADEEQEQAPPTSVREEKPVTVETVLSPMHSSTMTTPRMMTSQWVANTPKRTKASPDPMLWNPDEELDESLLAATWMATIIAGALMAQANNNQKAQSSSSNIDNVLPGTPMILNGESSRRLEEEQKEPLVENTITLPEQEEPLLVSTNTSQALVALETNIMDESRRRPPMVEASTDGVSPRYHHPMPSPFLAAAVWLASPRSTAAEENTEALLKMTTPRDRNKEPVVLKQQEKKPPATTTVVVEASHPPATKLTIEMVEVFPTPLADMMLSPLTVSENIPSGNKVDCCQSAAACGAWGANYDGNEEPKEPATTTNPTERRHYLYCMGDNAIDTVRDDAKVVEFRPEKSVADDLTDAPSDDSDGLAFVAVTGTKAIIQHEFFPMISTKGEEEEEEDLQEEEFLSSLGGVELILHDGEEDSIDTNGDDEIQQARDEYDSFSDHSDEIDAMILSPSFEKVNRPTNTNANPRRSPDPILEIRQALSDGDAVLRREILPSDSDSNNSSSSSSSAGGQRRMSRRLGGPEEMIHSNRASRSRRRTRRSNAASLQKTSTGTEDSDDSLTDLDTQELLECNEKLLESIVNFDYATYSALVSENLTGIESGGMQVGVRQNFQAHHRNYPSTTSSGGTTRLGMVPTKVLLVNPAVRLLSSNVALVTYTRVDELMEGGASNNTTRLEWNETRVWEKRQQPDQEAGGERYTWVNCHYHQSKQSIL
jgi:hypothetical protein